MTAGFFSTVPASLPAAKALTELPLQCQHQAGYHHHSILFIQGFSSFPFLFQFDVTFRPAAR